MPIHFLNCSFQWSAAQWTYLSILWLPPLQLADPSCKRQKGRQKGERGYRHISSIRYHHVIWSDPDSRVWFYWNELEIIMRSWETWTFVLWHGIFFIPQRSQTGICMNTRTNSPQTPPTLYWQDHWEQIARQGLWGQTRRLPEQIWSNVFNRVQKLVMLKSWWCRPW